MAWNIKPLTANLQQLIVPVHRQGYSFILVAALISLIITAGSTSLGLVGWAFTLLIAYMFRDPDRIAPVDDTAVVSPGDGMVHSVTESVPPEELGLGTAPLTCVRIDMRLLDVHIGRIPITGTVTYLKDSTAEEDVSDEDTALDDKSDGLTQGLLAMTITLNDGTTKIGLVQLSEQLSAGIIPLVKADSAVTAGQRSALARFGVGNSFELYLPASLTPHVLEGQRMVAGETTIGHVKTSAAKNKAAPEVAAA